jgi:hypothetical protein
MYRGAKRINTSLRGRIDTVKVNIRSATSPFDGDVVMHRAIAELRKEGVKIIYDRKMCRYYNAETVDESWGYTRTEEALE